MGGERLPRQRLYDLGRRRRNVGNRALDDAPRHLQRALKTGRHVDAELRQEAAHHVHQLGALLDQQVAGAVHRQRRLLIARLHRPEPHGGPRHRLANRLRVRGVGFAPLDRGLHVSRRHQPHIMAEAGQLAGPVMRCAARLHAYQAGWQLGEERHHLGAPQRLADDHITHGVDAVNLKHVLGQIQADRRDLHGGCSSLGFA